MCKNTKLHFILEVSFIKSIKFKFKCNRDFLIMLKAVLQRMILFDNVLANTKTV
jgi:hypothetical protein